MLIGRVDDIDNGIVYGWVFDKGRPDRRVQIQILWSEKEVHRGQADRFRTDLQESGFGDGQCAFEVPIQNVKFDDPIRVIAVATDGSMVTLPKAQLEERHLSRHFDSFSKEYKTALIELARRLTALEARFERREREASPSGLLEQIQNDILSIEKRLYETDVYLTRIDERLKKLSDQHSASKPNFFSRLFLGK